METTRYRPTAEITTSGTPPIMRCESRTRFSDQPGDLYNLFPRNTALFFREFRCVLFIFFFKTGGPGRGVMSFGLPMIASMLATRGGGFNVSNRESGSGFVVSLEVPSV